MYFICFSVFSFLCQVWGLRGKRGHGFSVIVRLTLLENCINLVMFKSGTASVSSTFIDVDSRAASIKSGSGATSIWASVAVSSHKWGHALSI